jgi:hypothetical protein
VWLLQEFIEGTRPPVLDARIAAQMTEILDIQSGLVTGGGGGWGEWAARAMFEDCEGLRGRVHTLPGGARIVDGVDAIAKTCAGARLRSCDLVHGDFSLTNVLASPKGLCVIDVADLDSGPLAYDLAKTLVVAATLDHATEAGLARLWSYGERFDLPELAVCVGACALKTAEAIVRHGIYDRAPSSLPRISKVLDRVRQLLAA